MGNETLIILSYLFQNEFVFRFRNEQLQNLMNNSVEEAQPLLQERPVSPTVARDTPSTSGNSAPAVVGFIQSPPNRNATGYGTVQNVRQASAANVSPETRKQLENPELYDNAQPRLVNNAGSSNSNRILNFIRRDSDRFQRTHNQSVEDRDIFLPPPSNQNTIN